MIKTSNIENGCLQWNYTASWLQGLANQ